MTEDKWIHDVQAGELINLKDCRGVYIESERDETEDYSAAYTLQLVYHRDKNGCYLHYGSKELLYNAFDHYKKLLKCEELDVSTKPVML